jgi:hypothetical protein
MQYNIKTIKETGAKVAVHCPTERDAKAVVKIMWMDIEFTNREWSQYTDQTCITVDGFCRVKSYVTDGYTIIPASLFLSHNLPEKKPFAVKAGEWELYEKFVKECEGMGWVYEPGYTDTNRYVFGKSIIKNEEVLGFLVNKKWTVCDEVSDGDFFHLETQYDEAIAAAKAWFVEEVERDIFDAVADYREAHPVEEKPSKNELLQEKVKELEADNYKLEQTKDRQARKIMDLEHDILILQDAHKKLHASTVAKLTATIMLLDAIQDGTHRQKNFSVNAIRTSLQKWIDEKYNQPDTDNLPF